MQTYNIKFQPGATATALFVDANLFVYESGKATVDGANLAVLVKPENGAEIVLKPGQRFRLAPGANARNWAIRSLDETVTLQAAFVIGSGEFEDSNTTNTFKLDGTFTNTVKVNNTAAERVPVDIDPKQLAQNTAPVMAYTDFKNITGVASGSIVALITPAENTAGVIVESVYQNGANGTSLYIGKTSPPASISEGATLYNLTNSVLSKDRVKLAPGVGLYYISGMFSSVNVSFTKL